MHHKDSKSFYNYLSIINLSNSVMIFIDIFVQSFNDILGYIQHIESLLSNELLGDTEDSKSSNKMYSIEQLEP